MTSSPRVYLLLGANYQSYPFLYGGISREAVEENIEIAGTEVRGR